MMIICNENKSPYCKFYFDHTAVRFQVFLSNINNHMFSSYHFYLIIVISLNTVI